jgi:GT2 family glycosyltransferase
MSLSLSVIVPTWNHPELLRACLQAIRASTISPCEIVVVDDCSEKPSDAVCAEYGAAVTRLPIRSGSAMARNVGAEMARGDVVVFVDGDVCVSADALERIREDFEADSELDAAFGSYEERAGANNFVSRYKNFQHHFVHQHSRPDAWTFWSGCGAIRREVFLAQGGFRVTYPRPDVEDIEFGMRLFHAGGKLRLDRTVRALHMRRWSIRTLIWSDVMGRAAPWTELLLRHRCLPDDLNLRWGQRLSVMLAVVSLLAVIAGCAELGAAFAWPMSALLFLGLASCAVDAVRNGPTTVATIGVCGVAFLLTVSTTHAGDLLLIPLIAVAYGLVLAGIRARIVGVYFVAVTAVILWQVPRHWLSFAVLAGVASIIWLNRDFYAFLLMRWGMPNTLSAIAFHLVYYLSSATGAAVGLARHVIALRGLNRSVPFVREEEQMLRCAEPVAQAQRWEGSVRHVAAR